MRFLANSTLFHDGALLHQDLGLAVVFKGWAHVSLVKDLWWLNSLLRLLNPHVRPRICLVVVVSGLLILACLLWPSCRWTILEYFESSLDLLPELWARVTLVEVREKLVLLCTGQVSLCHEVRYVKARLGVNCQVLDVIWEESWDLEAICSIVWCVWMACPLRGAQIVVDGLSLDRRDFTSLVWESACVLWYLGPGSWKRVLLLWVHHWSALSVSFELFGDFNFSFLWLLRLWMRLGSRRWLALLILCLNLLLHLFVDV